MTSAVRKDIFSVMYANVSSQQGIDAFVFGDDLVEMLRIQEQKSSQLSRQLALQIAAIGSRLDEYESERLIGFVSIFSAFHFGFLSKDDLATSSVGI